MHHDSIVKNRGRVLFQVMTTSMVSLITILCLFLYIFDMLGLWVVVLSAILANLIQIGLIKSLVGKIKNLVIRANEAGVRLGYQPRNVDADDIVGCNAAYAKMMILNAMISLILPWVLVFTALII